MYEIIDEYGVDFDYSILNKVIEKTLEMENAKDSIFSVIFIDDEKMRELNKTYRGIDKTTDVLSFAYEDNENMEYVVRHLGEIFVSIPRMMEQAKEYGHGYLREIAFLVVHGLLHLLGYDHTRSKEEEKIQFEKQELVLNEFEETRRT